MTCGEVREVLFAFLDNELDAPLSIELQRHLEGCAACAHEAEIERVVQKRLVSTVAVGARDFPGFPEDIEEVEQLVSRDVQPTGVAPTAKRSAAFPPELRMRPKSTAALFSRNRRLVGVAAVLLLAVSAVFGFLYKYSKPAATPFSFTDTLVADFEHFLEEGRELQIDSDDRDVVADWLLDKTALAVVMPVANDSRCRLVGGRKCKIAGRPAAFAIYRIGADLASYVALQESEQVLEPMKRIEHNGRTHWVDRCRGHTVLACRRGGIIYAVVSKLPAESLMPLMLPQNVREKARARTEPRP